jgi:hypothetical protein
MLNPARLTLNDESPVFNASDAPRQVSAWFYGIARFEGTEARRLTDWLTEWSETALASRGFVVAGEWLGDVLFLTERFGTEQQATSRIVPDEDGLYALPGRDLWQWTFASES